MRIVSFALPTPLGPTPRVAALVAGGQVIDLTLAAREWLADRSAAPSAARAIAETLVPPRTVAFVAGGQVTLDAAGEALAWVVERGVEATGDGSPLRRAFDDLALLPAVVDPPMLRDFMAFETHVSNIYPRLGREVPREWYEMPVYYKANTASLGAHGDDVAMPSYADELDFEFEFAAVIGTPGSDIPREEALGHVYGWTIYNDFSARAIQSREMAVGLGPAKGKDFHRAHVLGPAIVTADEIDDVYDLGMAAAVNGEPWSESETSTMHWRFEDMIAHASRDEPLRAGEVLGSGTVGDGCGAERGVFLGPGDVVELTVEGLGTLRNRVVAPSGRR